MDILIIVLIALAAVAAVLFPLLKGQRRHPALEEDARREQAERAVGAVDAAEPDAPLPRAAPAAPAAPLPPLPPAVPASPGHAAGEAGAPGIAHAAPGEEGSDLAARARGTPEVEAEILRYRAALRAGALCPRCHVANEAGARFCAGCGAALVEDAALPDGDGAGEAR
jgi:type IV secretion system protein VirB10